MPVSPRYLEPSRRSRRSRMRGRGGGLRFGGPTRRRRTPRLGPVVAVALLGALVVGLVVLLVTVLRGEPGRDQVERFAKAWEHGDRAAMYTELSDGAKRRYSRAAFDAAYRRAATTATVVAVDAGKPRDSRGGWQLPVTVRTRIFGAIRGSVRLDTSGDPARIDWTPAAAFPGLRAGQRLRRLTRAPRRAALLARDGRLLADPDGTVTSLGAATGIVGELGGATGGRRRALVAEGFAADAPVGVSGLEQALDARLRGRPGGTLLAGRRVLARSAPRPAPPVRSSLDPALTQAAQSALGGQFGGVAAVQPRTGEVLALAGIALDGAQPPGSTFKIMTVTAALQDGRVRLSSQFPVRTGATVEGRFVANANDEACGGDLVQSFSKSCNSVFAPLGERLGARRVVDIAQRFGFNHPPGVPGAKASTLPQAADVARAGEAGVSAIGQGRVLATPLQMAVVGATIANDGRRPLLTLVHGARPRSVPATTPRVAALVKRLMISVVEGAEATGTAAAIGGVRVAGKTGTAELGGGQPNDAWFVAFAPAERPTIAVAVLVVHGGFGGETAAPIAKQVLQAGL